MDPLLASALAVALASGCSPSEDLSGPVENVATGPYACAGVPLEGFALMVGTSALHSEETRYAADRVGCNVYDEDDEMLGFVSVGEASPIGSSDVETAYLAHSGMPGYTETTLPGRTGAGWFRGSTDTASARWYCGEYEVVVEVVHLAEGRDATTDVQSYVESMLPWVCDGADFPERDDASE